MDSWGIRLSARDLGIRLSVTKDDDLRCEPGERLTPEIRGAIRANREDILYDVLLSDALRYVAVECHVEGADPGAVLDDHQDALDAAYHARDWPGFRTAVRAFARAGRREAERARQAIGEASGCLEALAETQREAVRPGVRDRRASDSGVLSRRRERGAREPAGAGL